MKRSTKLLITATVAASIVGVGAVSYAIWSAGSAQQEVSAITGLIRTVGDITVEPSAESGTLEKMNALYPVDHGGSYLKYWTFTLSAEVPGGEEAAKFSLAGELSAGSSGVAVTSAKLYWAAAAPTADTGAVPENELTSTATQLTGLTDNTVYVYMVATGTDAMKAKITLTFSAS